MLPSLVPVVFFLFFSVFALGILISNRTQQQNHPYSKKKITKSSTDSHHKFIDPQTSHTNQQITNLQIANLQITNFTDHSHIHIGHCCPPRRQLPHSPPPQAGTPASARPAACRCAAQQEREREREIERERERERIRKEWRKLK